jgi:hypothetical protein
LLATALSAAALGAGGCVEELVVGIQKQPVDALDGGELDGGTREADAETADDAEPEPDATLNAEAGEDAGPAPSDAGWYDGGTIFLTGSDAGCASPGCKPDDDALGPCSSCDVTVSARPADGCTDELPFVCWQDADGGCSEQCPDADTCSATNDCATDEYCYFPRGDCGESQRGWCAPRPRTCPSFGVVGCACDGQSYEGSCFAAQAGFSIPDLEHVRCLL